MKKLALLAAVLLATTALTACGDYEDDGYGTCPSPYRTAGTTGGYAPSNRAPRPAKPVTPARRVPITKDGRR